MKEEDLVRLKRVQKVFNEKKVSGRKFAGSIGLQPGSGAKLLGGITKLTKTLARSIELEYGYRANWLYYGEEPEKVDPLEKLDPIQRIQLDILKQGGVAPELKAESLKMMVSNQAHGVLLGMMMISLRHSRNIQDSVVPKNVLDKYEKNRIKANELLNKFDIAFEEGCNKLNPQEKIVLVCDVYVELQQLKYNCIQSIGDDVSRSEVMSILSGLIGIIRQIRELTKSEDDYEKSSNEELLAPDKPVKVVAKGRINLLKL